MPPSLQYPDSLCHRCEARRYVQGRATTFVMCTALPDKYPRQPVLACPAFRQRERPDGDDSAKEAEG